MAEKKKDTKKNDELQVINENGKLRVEQGDKFVEGDAEMSYFDVCSIEDMSVPEKVKVHGSSEEMTMYQSEKSKTNTKVNLYILENTLTGWSLDEKITYDNIKKSKGLGLLFKKYITEIKILNGLQKEKEEKKSE